MLANDYDPEGGTLVVTAVTPFDGADVAPGLNGQTVDVRVAPTVVSSFTLSYTVADKAGNQSTRSSTCASCRTEEVASTFRSATLAPEFRRKKYPSFFQLSAKVRLQSKMPNRELV